MHKEGRRSLEVNVESVSNVELFFTNFCLKEDEHKLLTNLSSIIIPLKECCDKTYSEIDSNVEYIREKSLTNKLYWSSIRQFKITGSRCYSIFTYCQKPKSDEQWETKANNYFWPKQFSSKSTNHGIEFENIARDLYSQKTGQKVYKSGFITSSTEKWLGYSPDGLLVDANNYPSKLIEIKCPFKGKTLNINELMSNLTYIKKTKDGMYYLKTKHAYYNQVQLGMVMLNINKCDFIVYSSFDHNYSSIEVPLDEDYTKILLEKLKSVYFSKMLHVICKFKK